MKKYLHIKYLHIAVVVVSLLLVGCTNHEDSPKNPSPDKSEELIRPNYNWNGARPLQEIAPKNVERINTFSINLFKTVFKNNVENMCISPASVFYTLSMMANGDDGKSRDEILDVLGYPIGEEGLLELNVFANALLRETTQFEGDTQCGFTNSIWHRPSMNLLPTFTTIIKDIYGGIIQPIWLGDENGLTTLNTFICNQTQGITTSFLNKTDLSNLIFFNSPYFTGTWKIPFSSESGQKKQFSNYYGAYTSTPFITTSDCEIEATTIDLPVLDYIGSPHRILRMIQLPYDDERYIMTIMQPIPFSISAFNYMLETLDNTTLASHLEALHKESFRLWIPKFKTTFNKDILDQLAKMGLYYVPTHGLRMVGDDVVNPRKFPHALSISADQPYRMDNGIEEISGTIVDNSEILLINSPFIYMIQDTLSGSILFMGALISFN